MGRSGNHRAGLTLVEVLVAMSIALVVSAVLVMTWLSLTRSYSVTTRGSHAGELARDAVSRLSREIRDAEPDPLSGDPAIVDFDPAYVEFTTTFNQEGNDQPLPSPVLTRYVYRLNEASGAQTLHRLRDSNGDGELTSADRDDVVVSNLRNYSNDSGTWELTVAPFEFLRLDPATRLPVEASESTPPRYIGLVRVHLLVQMPGSRPRPTDLITTVQLRNQAL